MVNATMPRLGNSHDTRLEVVAVDVVLTAEALAQLLRVELARLGGSLDERIHQRLHNLITRQLHVERRPSELRL